MLEGSRPVDGPSLEESGDMRPDDRTGRLLRPRHETGFGDPAEKRIVSTTSELVAEDEAVTTPAPPAWLGLGYALTIFLSAFLLFQVQPLVSKAILPWFGGTPSVWTVCMLFFQSLLFGGYLYSHVVTTRLEPRFRLGLHLVLLAVACALLPILPAESWKPTGEESPTLRIVVMLLATVGLPFFVLSTTGPLLQAWFAGTHPGRSPYRLYALSNIGSLLALLSYPFLFEPMMGLVQQSATWSWAFGAFAVACATCGVGAMSFRSVPNESRATESSEASESVPDTAAPTWDTMGFWFVLATVPSVMLLATTNQVCLDVASVPFLWVLPLSLYLLSFILCFDSDWWYSRSVFGLGVVLMSAAMIAALAAGPSMAIQMQVAIFFAGLFCTAMFCHGELARSKPDPRYLTHFYLVMSAGGAAGGLFTGLLAPVIFTAYLELHLAILAASVLVFVVDWRAMGADPEYKGWSRPVLLAIVVVIGIGLGSDVFSARQDVIASSRNFYGVLRVTEDSEEEWYHARKLLHGRILHGKQFLKGARKTWPTTYYGRASGVGLAMAHHHPDRPRTLGVVGLGTGTIATYAKEGDTLVYYEINDDVIRIANTKFSYLPDCRAEKVMRLGDARLTLEREEPRGFDVLALDAFSSDAIPAHLLTREAMDQYLRHLAEDGILAVHISNKHFDLEPILAAHAEEREMGMVVVNSEDFAPRGTSRATWVLMSRRPEVLTVRGYVCDDVPSRSLIQDALNEAWLSVGDDEATLFVGEVKEGDSVLVPAGDFDLKLVEMNLLDARATELVPNGKGDDETWSLLVRGRDLTGEDDDGDSWVRRSSWTVSSVYDEKEPIMWTDDETNLVEVMHDLEWSDVWEDLWGG